MSRLLGIIGESQAEKFLKKLGYKIIEKNYHSRFGEIDIIAKDKEKIVFVEVKKRKNADFAGGAEYVDLRKQKKIIAKENIYLQNITQDCNIRFDVVEINSDKISHIKNAFFT